MGSLPAVVSNDLAENSQFDAGVLQIRLRHDRTADIEEAHGREQRANEKQTSRQRASPLVLDEPQEHPEDNDPRGKTYCPATLGFTFPRG